MTEVPNLPVHLDMAFKVRDRLEDPEIESHLGCFLLGSTTPDIRAMTKGRREDTHFAPLSTRKIGTGAAGLFSSHPELADKSKLGPATAAFLAGYLTHLAADETWILEVYQQYLASMQRNRTGCRRIYGTGLSSWIWTGLPWMRWETERRYATTSRVRKMM
jgi:hypothetical protein